MGDRKPMNELTASDLSQAAASPDATQALLGKMLARPQVSIGVCHLFGPNTYMRELTIPAGALVVGRVHREAHDCILWRGVLTIYGADEVSTQLRAPLEFRAEPGRKIVHADEDVVFVCVFRTAERDVETLEEQIFMDAAPCSQSRGGPPDGDYEAMLAEVGVAAETVRELSERSADLCPLPFGRYKFKVGRSHLEGKGLIATADIAANECIAAATVNGKRTPASRYANHAREPNAMFVYAPDGAAWLMAIRPIAGCRGGYDGEEITVDYRRTPRARWALLS